jgi:hypothetical protein
MSQNNLGLIAIILITLSITSCASVDSGNYPRNKNAKLFEVEKNKSNIYLYRNQLDSFDLTISAEIDGKSVTDTEHKTFIITTLEPGKHVITAHAENISKLEINTESGKNYYIWLEVTLGLNSPRAKLHSVDEQRGKYGVKNSTLIN